MSNMEMKIPSVNSNKKESSDSSGTHVSEKKKMKVKELAGLMKKKTVMVISIKGLPSAQFQDIKKKLRDKAKIQVVKKSLINFSLNHCGIKELYGLTPFVDDSTAILFSDEDAFVISGILSEEKSPTKAKIGQIAPFDIEVKAGPTELIPGPDISALSAVGLAPKVENGKIAIMKDKIILKEGKEINADVASIMSKLDIIPFEVGIDPIAAFDSDSKKIYADIKIDKEKMIFEIVDDFTHAFALSVNLSIMNSETLGFILNKAGCDGLVIESLITEGNTSSNEEGGEEDVDKKIKTGETQNETTN